jgi:hypothetical protein
MTEARLTVSVVEKGVQSTTKDLNKLSTSAKSAEKTTKKFGSAAKKSEKSLGIFGRRAGQAGIQVQQFVGQIQGGTNAAVALSQQSADLGFVLGFPLLGAVTGIAAAFAGTLLPALFSSKDASEELEEALKNLSNVIDITDDNVIQLSRSVLSLAQVNEKAAKLQIATGLLESAKASEAAADVLQESISDIVGGLTIGEERLGVLVKAYEKTGKSLIDAFPENRDFATRINFPALTDALVELKDDFDLTSEEAARFFSAIGNQVLERSAESSEALGEVVADLGLKYGTSNRKLLEIASSFSSTTNKINEQARAAEALSKILKSIDEEGADFSSFDNSLQDKLRTRAKREKEQQEKINQEKLKREEFLFARSLKLREEFNRKNEEADFRAFERLQERKSSAENFLIEVGQLGESPTDQITRIELEKIEKLKEFRDQELISDQEFQNAKTAIAEDAAQKRKDIEIQSASLILSSSADLFDSLAKLEKTFGDEKSGRFKALFALSKGFAIANSILNLNAAIAQAAADPTALTPAQKFANIAAVSSSIGGVVSSIASASYPARAQGGQFAANQPFLVGENGAEIVQFNSGGRIANNTESQQIASGSNSPSNVVIINQTSGRIDEVAQSSREDGTLEIKIKEILQSQVDLPNSDFNKSFSRTRRAQRIL